MLQSSDYKYFAFISYSRKNSRAAAFVQRRLEHFRIPLKHVAIENRPAKGHFVRPVFRDKRDLDVSVGSFTSDIRKALEESRYLLVICSRESAASKWVNEEVKYFLACHENDLSCIVPIVLEGEPGSGTDQECLPESLSDAGLVALGIDGRMTERNLPTMIPDDGAKEIDGWENGVIQTLSYLLKVNRESVKASIDAERVRQMKIYAIIAAVCTCVFAGLALWAIRAERRAEANRRIAEANEERAVAGEHEANRQRAKAEDNWRVAETNRSMAEANWRIAELNREKAEANERRAVAGEKLAVEKRELAEKTLDFVKRMLQEGKPDEHGPKNVVDLLSEQVSKIDLLKPDELRYSVATLVGQIMQEQTLVRPAEHLLKESVGYYRTRKEWVKFADAANSLAILYSTTGRGEESLRLQSELENSGALKALNKNGRALHFYNVALSYFNNRDINHAQEYCDKAADILSDAECKLLAHIRFLKAEIVAARGNRPLALQMMADALALCEKTSGERDLGLLQQYARLNVENGSLDSARKTVNEVIEAARKAKGESSSILGMAYNTLGVIENEQGRPAQAIELFEKALAILEGTTSKGDSRTVQVYNNFGTAYCKLNNYVRARQYFEKALALGERLYGVESPELFNPLLNLGYVSIQTRKPDEAEKQLLRANAIVVRAYGKDHPNLTKVYNNLSSCAVNHGRWAAALSYASETWRLLQVNKMERSRGGAIAMSNMAQANEKLGSHSNAVMQITQAMAIAQECLDAREEERRKLMIAYEWIAHGKTDSEVLNAIELDKATVKQKASEAIKDFSRNVEAKRLYEQLLEILSKRGESSSDDYALALNQLGVLAYRDRKYSESVAYHRQAILIKERIFGKGSPELALNYQNIGSSLNMEGDINGSICYYLMGVSANQMRKPPDQKFASDSYTFVSRLFARQEDYTNAVEYAQKALTCDMPLYGTNSAAVAIDYKDLADVLRKARRYHEAVTNYQHALRIREGITNTPDSVLAVLYNDLGISYGKSSEYDKALACYRKSYQLDVAAYGVTNKETAVALDNLGTTERKLGDLTNAIEHLRLSLVLKRTLGGFSPKDIAILHNDLGIAYSDNGNHEKALEQYLAALEIDLREFGREDKEVMTVYGNMALEYKALNQNKLEGECLRKSLDISLLVYPDDHEEVLERYDNMAKYLYRMEKYDKCSELRKKILQIVNRREGSQSMSVAKEYQSLGLALALSGDYDGARTNFQQSVALYRTGGAEYMESVAVLLSNLGFTEKMAENLPAAIEDFEEALSIAKSQSLSIEPGSDLGNAKSCLEECKRLLKTWPIVRISKVETGKEGAKLGLTVGDIWYSLGRWKASDSRTQRRNVFWKTAKDEWKALNNTNRTLTVLRKTEGGLRRVQLDFSTSDVGFTYEISDMPKDELDAALRIP